MTTRRLALLSLFALLIGAALPVATASAANPDVVCQLLGLFCPRDPDPVPNPPPPTPTTPTIPTVPTIPTTQTTPTETTPDPNPPEDGRHCLAGVGDVSSRQVGPIKLGDPVERIRNVAGVPPTHEEEGLVRYCIKSGGRIDVSFQVGRAALIVTRAPGYRYKQLGPGDPVSALRKGAKGAHKDKTSGFRIGQVLVGEDSGFVKYVAPVSRDLLHDRDALKRHLRRAGV